MSLQEIFSLQNIIIYFIVVNLVGFFIMWLDKRKAQYAKWRIKENTLLFVAGIGGSIGTIIRYVYI